MGKRKRGESMEKEKRVLFGVLVAAVSQTKKNKSLINLCLNKLSRFSTKQQSFPIAFLSLLPLILSSKCVRRGAELVGTASLFSYETNHRIASDAPTLIALISALRNAKPCSTVLLASVNALLDLSTTDIGRTRLIHFSALEALMFKFLEVSEASQISVSLCDVSDDEDVTSARIRLQENELLNAALVLVRSCDIGRFESIPKELYEAFFLYLKEIWEKVRHQTCSRGSSDFTQRKLNYSSNVRISDVAESIFRLSTLGSSVSKLLPFKITKNGIFGSGDSSFKDFMLNYWETSPFVVDKVSRISTVEDDIFKPFIQSLNSEPSDPSFVSTMLQGMVSCLPISSYELDILSFLKEFGGRLGCPLIYQQDIRVLKTDRKLESSELHYFKESSGASLVKNPHYLGTDNIMQCEEALKEGYTIALRGMEFRFKSVAAIADALAAAFGQPSAGANLYLTPPSSQGLTRHYDDHCVFVCQLFGTKHWKLFHKPDMKLPRLYDPLNGSYSSGVETSMSESKQVLLKEGDILYIPRGVPHEACTHSNEAEQSSGYSLHLTLGIEVEPPFEWEGFAHAALHCWICSQKQYDYSGADCISANLGIIAVNLLHVVINFIGESDHTFRKACLVAGTSSSDAGDWLQASKKNILSHMMEKIKSVSSFSDVISALELSAQKNENPLDQIRWLKHLHFEGENSVGCYCTTLMSTQKLFDICSEQRYKAETIFLQTKSNFCKVEIFDFVFDKYKSLLERYRKVRKQYMSGMLSLHRN